MPDTATPKHAATTAEVEILNPTAAKASEPALTASSVAAAVHTVAVVLGFLGFAAKETQLDGEAQTIGGIVVGIATVLFHLGAGAWIRARVKPVADLERSVQARLVGVFGQLSTVLGALNGIAAKPVSVALPVQVSMSNVDSSSLAQSVAHSLTPVVAAQEIPGVLMSTTIAGDDDEISDEPDPDADDDETGDIPEDELPLSSTAPITASAAATSGAASKPAVAQA